MENPRRRRFLAWFKETYGEVNEESRKRFMRDTRTATEEPITKGRVSQLFDDKQPFADAAARNLAIRLGLAEDKFLHDPSPGLSPELDRAVQNMRDIARINPETFDLLLDQLQTIAEGARTSDAFFKTKTGKGYVTPKRAAETLGKPALSHDQAGPAHQAQPQSASGFGELMDVPAPPSTPQKQPRPTLEAVPAPAPRGPARHPPGTLIITSPIKHDGRRSQNTKPKAKPAKGSKGGEP